VKQTRRVAFALSNGTVPMGGDVLISGEDGEGKETLQD